MKGKINTLRRIRNSLSKTKATYLTCKEIRDILIKGEDMPTAIFGATKTEYIVKPRTIFGHQKRKKRY